MNPTYEDKVKVVNKITLCPGTDREYTYLLEPHVGKARGKDVALLTFVMKLRDSSDYMEIFKLAAESEEFETVAMSALDLDDPAHVGVSDTLTFVELLKGFMDAIEYRSSGMAAPEVQKAQKK